MQEYSPPNKDANNPPVEWFDIANMFCPAVLGKYSQQHPIPPDIKDELATWIEQANALAFEQYRKFMHGRVRTLAAAEPRLVLDILFRWAEAMPPNMMLPYWLAELFALAEPSDTPETIAARIRNALEKPSALWGAACRFGRDRWKKLSDERIRERLMNYLADHVASQIWLPLWLKRKLFPQLLRTEPYLYEQHNKDIMEAWDTMDPKEAISCGWLERIFGDKARQLPGYNPEHPRAHAVKIEQPKIPPPGLKAFLLVGAILPLVLHHHWSAVDILRILIIARPGLATQFQLDDPVKRALGCRYVHRQLLEAMGIELNREEGRPGGTSNSRPPAFEAAYLFALVYQEMSF
jgi:hypothetical protein